MVRRKPFIDKKNSTTYNLLYRAKEIDVHGEENGAERELVDASKATGLGSDVDPSMAGGSGRFPPGHPLAWLQVLRSWTHLALQLSSCWISATSCWSSGTPLFQSIELISLTVWLGAMLAASWFWRGLQKMIQQNLD